MVLFSLKVCQATDVIRYTATDAIRHADVLMHEKKRVKYPTRNTKSCLLTHDQSRVFIIERASYHSFWPTIKATTIMHNVSAISAAKCEIIEKDKLAIGEFRN